MADEQNTTDNNPELARLWRAYQAAQRSGLDRDKQLDAWLGEFAARYRDEILTPIEPEELQPTKVIKRRIY